MRDLLYLVLLQSLIPGVNEEGVVPYLFVLRIQFINVHPDDNESCCCGEVGARNNFQSQAVEKKRYPQFLS